mgnify:CR=1 FL=1
MQIKLLLFFQLSRMQAQIRGGLETSRVLGAGSQIPVQHHYTAH